MKKSLHFTAKVRLWPGEGAAWHFGLLPKEESTLWREKYKGLHRGWNSIKVQAQVGKTVWLTSVFFNTRSSRYILPFKASVRKTEDIYDEDEVKVKLTIV